METTELKYDVKAYKAEIKQLSETQRELRNQRKTVNLKGERTMEPSLAAWKHQVNGERLRVMFAIYGLMRGKSFSVTENHYPEENHPLNKYKNEIDSTLVKYLITVPMIIE